MLADSTARWLFLGFAVAFAVKVPLFPLHTWLPDAHTEAPTAGSVILAGVLLKLGTYGLLRFGLYLFPEAADWFAPGLVTLGVIGIIYGAVVAAMQKDLKRLVAYSSVAHLGFIVLGTFALTTQGRQGGRPPDGQPRHLHRRPLPPGGDALRAPPHPGDRRLPRAPEGGPVLRRRLHRRDAQLHRRCPGSTGSSASSWCCIGSFLTRRWWAVVAATGVILAAVYLLWAYQRVFHGEPDEENAATPDLSWREGLVLAPLLAAIVFLGVYPRPVLERIEPAVDRLLDHVEDRSGEEQPPGGHRGARGRRGDRGGGRVILAQADADPGSIEMPHVDWGGLSPLLVLVGRGAA